MSAGPATSLSTNGLGPESLIVRSVRDGDWIAAVAIRWEEPTDV
jgi:hypothetical protein